MSRDGELTSHLPLMKAPTPVMLLVGEPWECRDDSEEVFGVTDIGRSRVSVSLGQKNWSRTRGYAPLLRSAAPTWV